MNHTFAGAGYLIIILSYILYDHQECNLLFLESTSSAAREELEQGGERWHAEERRALGLALRRQESVAALSCCASKAVSRCACLSAAACCRSSLRTLSFWFLMSFLSLSDLRPWALASSEYWPDRVDGVGSSPSFSRSQQGPGHVSNEFCSM